MPKFGVSIYSISRKIISKELTPEAGIEWLAAQGSEVVEIVPFGIDLIGEAGLAGRLARVASDSGAPIDNYSLNANFVALTQDEYNAEMDRVKANMNVACELKASTMRIDCAGYRRLPEQNTAENFQKDFPLIIETYRELCAHAEKLGLTLLLENHGFYVNGGERIRQIMAAMADVKNFGHQLDTGNYVCVDDIAEFALKKTIQYASTIHMKDFYIRDENPGDATQFDCSGSWFRSSGGRYLRGSILAQGDLDIRKNIRLVKESGFNGNIFIEFEGMEDCFYGTKVSLDNLKRIYNEI